jgi:hypothetical protein
MCGGKNSSAPQAPRIVCRARGFSCAWLSVGDVENDVLESVLNPISVRLRCFDLKPCSFHSGSCQKSRIFNPSEKFKDYPENHQFIMRLRLLALSGLVLLSLQFSAQDWVISMQDPQANFYDIRNQFENYWATRDKTEKGKGYKVFKRWENFVERRVYPSGDLSLLATTATNYQAFYDDYQAKQSTAKVIGTAGLIASATWTPIGPMGAISGSAGSQLLKSGRLNFITIDPTNSNNLWVGAPAGGLWKSTNAGTSWTTNTDFLAVHGCSDLAIDPTNTSVMYLATGDGDGGDTRSIGVLKSLNGGSTWTTTGLSFGVSSNVLIRRLLINPSNTQILMAATSQGIYRTTNGGTNWTQITTNSTHDLEFKPGDPNTVYASGSSFRLSTNGGASFTLISSGITTTGVNRMAIAVTSNDPTYVYVLASNSSNSGFYGLYRSTNSGTSFSLMSSSPNLLGWSSTGSDTGGQGWYDLCIAASPLDKNEVVVGGVNVWRSLNGGTSWSLYGHWTGSGAPFTHADHHDLEYNSTGTLYNTNDGTVYRRGATSWAEISGSMNISQIYRIGMSSLTANRWITGHQDNGTSIWNGSTYNAAMGGDGMDCFYDRTNNNNVFAEYYSGDLEKSTNGGASWSSCVSGLTGTAPWVTIWKQDPQAATTLYCGYSNLFKSTNLAGSWTQLTALPATGTIREFAVAPSNNQVIYVLKSNGIYKTTNGGTSWTTVTGSVPVGSAAPEYICIDPNDPNNAWVVLSGYLTGNKVFVTFNGGTSWTNISGNLPNIPVNCIVYEPGTSDRVYIGMDVGVYYTVGSSSTWTLYNNSLPNAPVTELEISPASPQFIHAATFGRGVWVASVVGPMNAPVTSFNAPTLKCQGAAITFSDQSTNSPTGWNWSVNPPAGVSANSYTVQNPSFTFANAGNFTVSLQTSNGVGAGNTFSQAVVVSSSPQLNVAATTTVICAGSPITFTASGANTYTWSNGGGNSSITTFSPLAATVYSVTGATNGCVSSKTIAIATTAALSVSVNGGTVTCAGSPTLIIASGASTYVWSNSAQGASVTVSPQSTTVYSVVGTAGPCSATGTIQVDVLPLPQINIWSSRSIACINDSVTIYVNGALNYTWLHANFIGDTYGFFATSAFNFTVHGVDANGCENSVEYIQAVEECVSIASPNAALQNIKVYPNPFSTMLTIDYSAGIELMHVKITDVIGRELRGETHACSGRGKLQLDTEGFADGIYLLSLSIDGSGFRNYKIVKE